MARRVAITGAAGFLGGHFVRGLRARGHEVVPVVRAIDARSDALSGARTLEEMLAGAEAAAASDVAGFAGIDVLVHAAAVRHRHGVSAKDYRETNVELVERLLRAFGGAGANATAGAREGAGAGGTSGSAARRFVYVSSVGVYGFPPASALPITEATPFAPATLYSVTKVEAERAVRRLAPELGLEWTIVRPTIVYGAGDDNGMLDKTARMIRAGTYRVVGSGENTLHHTHVDDIVEGIALAVAHAGAAGEDFIFAGPETVTLERFSSLVARAVGKRLPRLHVPLAVARLAASVFDVAAYRGLMTKEPPVNHEKLDVMTRAIAFSSDKAARLLGFRAKVSYEEGIARTLGR